MVKQKMTNKKTNNIDHITCNGCEKKFSMQETLNDIHGKKSKRTQKNSKNEERKI